HAEHTQIIIVGAPGASDARALRETVAARYLPFSVTVAVAPGGEQQRLAAFMPFIGPMTMRDGRATAYVCRAFACREPVTDTDALAAQL
ncbi:MAG TPA: hypothetical protein VFJ02_17915, partial [Vicinamibacterales bacterium]|nr:hypothetical protein [Vicinamibacterales bacterium]